MSDVQFIDTPRPEDTVKFTDEPRPEDLQWKDLPKNIVPNVVDIGKNAVGTAARIGKGVMDLPSDVVETAKDEMHGDFMDSPIAKDMKTVGGGVANAVEGIPKQFMGLFSKPEWIQHPVSNALTAGTVAAPFLGPEAEGSAAEASIPKIEPPIPSEEVSSIPKGAPVEMPKQVESAAAPPPQSVLSQIADSGVANKAKELKDYIGRGYESYAKKPGAINDVADYVQGKSQMMAAQQMGATPLQARQIGHEGMRAIGQYALDNDIVSPTTGLRGMRAQNTKLMDAAGEKLGAFRKAADTARNPMTDTVDVLQAIRAKLDPIFARGARSGEAGSYAKALEDVEDSKPTFEGVAETATKLNKAANEANRLKQPHGAYTDVANEISHVNNERIKQILGPQKAAQYEQALREFGINKKISSMLSRKEAGEVKRLGPGSLTSNMTQKMMDEIGYKFGAKAANKLSTSILKNPGIAKTLPSLFKEFINHVEETGDDATGMSEGGMVGPEVAEFVRSR